PDRISMSKSTSSRRKQNYRRLRANTFDRLEEWSGLHDHSRSTTVWIIIHCAVFVVRVLAQIHEVVFDAAGRYGARWNAQPKWTRKKLGKNRDDVYPERHGLLEQSDVGLDDDHTRAAISSLDNFRTIRDENAAARGGD